MNGLTLREMEQHVNVVGWLMIILHSIFLAIGAFAVSILFGIGAVSGDGEAMTVLTLVALGVGALMGLLALPGIAAGYGLLKRRPWGRVLAIVIAALNLFNFPVGTILGLYVMWVLFQNSAADYFTESSHPVYG